MAWSRIRGHDGIVQQLRQASERGRLAHAYLLVGPHGVGKRLFAKEFAKALLCEMPPASLTACDVCPGCKLVEAGTHPDFSTVRTPDDKHELPIDTMREFLTLQGLKPSRGPRKVGFVEDAGDFNEESANVFLKTLEEPPPGSMLLLRATSLESQLSTILSRCQPLRFAPLKADDVKTLLMEQGVTDSKQRDWLASQSHGSVGRALALNDPALAEFRRGILEALGAPKFNHAAFAERWTKFADEAGKESAAVRLRASLAIQLLIDLLQKSLRLAVASDINDDDAKLLKPFATRFGPEKLLAALEACLDADKQVEQKTKVELALELLADRLGQAA